jgi:hypothetical protein
LVPSNLLRYKNLPILFLMNKRPPSFFHLTRYFHFGLKSAPFISNCPRLGSSIRLEQWLLRKEPTGSFEPIIYINRQVQVRLSEAHQSKLQVDGHMASLELTSFSNIVQSEITGEVEKVLWEDGGKIISCKFSCCILWYHYFPRSRPSIFFL